MTDYSQVFANIITDTNLWAGIMSTIVVIGLGYVLVKIKVLKQEWDKIINHIVLKVALPALVIRSFMSDIDGQEVIDQAIVFAYACAFFIVMGALSMIWVHFFPKFVPKFVKKQAILSTGKVYDFEAKKFFNVNDPAILKGQALGEKWKLGRCLLMWMLVVEWSTTSFGQPIVEFFYPNDGFIATNVWNIPDRIFLYTFVFMVMSGLKFDKQNIKTTVKKVCMNPILIATVVGMILWCSQLIPGASKYDVSFTSGNHGWFNFNVTMPYFYAPINRVANMSTPMIWITIGMTLAATKLTDAVKDKWVWILNLEKLILIPLLVFFCMLGFVSSGLMSLEIGVTLVILAACPPSTVVAAYALNFGTKHESNFAAQCASLSSVLAIIAVPVWTIISIVAFTPFVDSTDAETATTALNSISNYLLMWK